MLAFSNIALFSTLAATLSLCGLAVAGSHESVKRRHPGMNFMERDNTTAKRDGNARFTYYEAGLGACGATNSDSDFVSEWLTGCERFAYATADRRPELQCKL